MALDSYRELIDELASGPRQLRQAAEAAGDPPEGEWGANEVMAHLAACEEFFLARVLTILSQPQPALHSFQKQADERMGELLSNDLASNIDRYSDQRGELVSQLMSMTLADWGRTGLHPTRGTISIEEVIESILDHDADHLQQLQTLAS